MASIVDSEGGNLEAKDAALEFATYEDYLDSQISQTDMYYLEVRTRALLNQQLLQLWLCSRCAMVRRTRI